MSPDERERVIRAFPFFATLPPAIREAVFSQAVSRTLSHKQILARDGGECSHLPFVLRGTLRIYKTSEGGREITLYRIETGESCILSATCIMNGGSFPAVAEAEAETEVLLVPAKLLHDQADTSPDWRRFLFGLYTKRLDNVLTLVDEIAFHHMDARLAAYLLKHATGRPASVAQTHVDIADELGTSREVVTRILRDFEGDGMIATSRGRIRIVRPEKLQERAVPFSAV